MKGFGETAAVFFLVSAILGTFTVGVSVDKFATLVGGAAQETGDKVFLREKIVPNAEKICATSVEKLPSEGSYQHRFSDLKEGKICNGDSICLNYESFSSVVPFKGSCSSYSIKNAAGGSTFDAGRFNFTLEEKSNNKLLVNVEKVGP